MPAFDVLIRNGRVVDGSGNPWFCGDVALNGDSIAAVTRPGLIDAARAAEVFDATGLVIAPGFIDIQSQSTMPLMIDGRSLSKITQGVTTEIMGEHWTPAPAGGRRTSPVPNLLFARSHPDWIERARSWAGFADWLQAMVERGVSPNIGSFVGGGTLREYVMGMEMRTPDPSELRDMQRLAAECMEQGALGVAYALIYPPEAYSETEEIVHVCREVAARGGIYATHMRSEGDALEAALAEAFDIGRRAGLPVEIYHLKASGKRNWHKMAEVVRAIDSARTSGLDVTAGMYPYTASGTGLASVLPHWVAAGGMLFDNLRDSATRERIRQDVLDEVGADGSAGAAERARAIMPVGLKRPENQPFVGKRMSEIAAARGQHWVDAVMDLLLSEEQHINTIYFTMSEDNLRLQAVQPWIKFSSDAGGYDPSWAVEQGPVHPRTYGAFARILGKYVRDESVLPLEEAIRKITSAVADRLGLRDRGLLRPGLCADVVVFDAGSVTDHATFEDPHRLSSGVREVWVNGARVLSGGAHTGATPGRVVSCARGV